MFFIEHYISAEPIDDESDTGYEMNCVHVKFFKAIKIVNNSGVNDTPVDSDGNEIHKESCLER